MTSGETDVQERLDWAVKIAQQAGNLTLQHFRRHDLEVHRKPDDSPVTIADRAAEELLRERIAERFPDDGIIGEEFDEMTGTTGYQWILDPVDGTKSFIHGVPLYTTLVAVLRGDEPQLGVINAPALGEIVYAARSRGAWHIPGTGQQPRPAHVSQIERFRDGLLLTSEVGSFTTDRSPDAMEVYLRLERLARLARTWGDGYGYLMVATGRAEVMIDPALSLWDIAPLQPIVEEAGGRFTNWRGESTIHTGEAIATNGLVADEVLAVTHGW